MRWGTFQKGQADTDVVGPHRVRTGQEIIVVDPSMEGYLPIPQTPIHEGPSEVILRFSTTSSPDQPKAIEVQSESPGQVFLHAVGATATFGSPLTRHPSRTFTIGSSPISLVHTPGSDGCSPFTLSHSLKGAERSAVVLLDRGGCTFLEKALHAVRAGAKGVIVAGLDPSTQSGMTPPDPDGLIRPSADGESTAILHEVGETPLVFIDWRGGDILRHHFSHSSDRGEVTVEVLSLDGQTDLSPDVSEIGAATSSGTGKSVRQGRVGVGDHVIWNLRIVDGKP